MKKYNIFTKNIEDKEIRDLQIAYMYYRLDMKPKKISEYVNLALSTIRNYARKFKDLVNKAIEYFEGKIATAVEKIKEKCNVTDIVTYNCDYRKGNCAYIIEYFDSQHNFVFLKVGKTDNIERRTKEHLRYYTNKGLDTTYAVVKQLFWAEDEDDALTLENCLRKHYKKINNCGFIRNDRFALVRYDKQELEQDTDTMQKLELFATA